MNNETAPVRPNEELDLASLMSYLRSHDAFLRVSEDRITIEQFPGGHSNLTYLIRLGAEEFVLRRPPLGPVAAKAHDMPREYRLLSKVHAEFPLAPTPILLCEDPSVIGAPFYLMKRRRGIVVRNLVPSEIGDNASTRRAVSEAVVDTLVELHAVNIYTTGIVQLGKPDGFVERQVNGWADRWLRSKTSDVPEMEVVINWLKANLSSVLRTPDSNATLVHNDFKLDNIMLDKENPSRVVAVLDWEMCSVGDPLIDLGLFLCYWTLSDKDDKEAASLKAVTTGPGWMKREELLARYESTSGRDVSNIGFYEVFALFRVAVILQQIFFRFSRGQTSDQRFSSFDRKVKSLAVTAEQMSTGF